MSRPASRRPPSRGSRFATLARLDDRVAALNEQRRARGLPPLPPLDTLGHRLQRAAVEGA